MAPCQRFAQAISDYADNELDQDSKERLEAHLNQCPGCAKYLRRLQVLKSTLRALSPVQPSQDFVPVLRDRLRKFQTAQPKPKKMVFSPGQRLVPALGLGALSILVALLVVDQTPESDSGNRDMAVQEKNALPERGETSILPEHETGNETAEFQSGFVAHAAESDTLSASDSTSNIQEFDEVRSRIRTVSY